jgi:hypothetical protein
MLLLRLHCALLLLRLRRVLLCRLGRMVRLRRVLLCRLGRVLRLRRVLLWLPLLILLAVYGQNNAQKQDRDYSVPFEKRHDECVLCCLPCTHADRHAGRGTGKPRILRAF